VPEHSYAQMSLCELPPETDLPALKTRLYDEFRVEIPVIAWGGRKFVRVSIQGYNTQADVDSLINALGAILDAPE
jgi:isopenicillin-N epimerase